MKIKFLDIQKINQKHNKEFMYSLDNFLKKGYFILGDQVSKFEDELDYVSKLESVINNNTSDYERYRIYDLIDPTNSHLSEKFMNCIDPNNFTPMSN